MEQLIPLAFVVAFIITTIFVTNTLKQRQEPSYDYIKKGAEKLAACKTNETFAKRTYLVHMISHCQGDTVLWQRLLSDKKVQNFVGKAIWNQQMKKRSQTLRQAICNKQEAA